MAAHCHVHTASHAHTRLTDIIDSRDRWEAHVRRSQLHSHFYIVPSVLDGMHARMRHVRRHSVGHVGAFYGVQNVLTFDVVPLDSISNRTTNWAVVLFALGIMGQNISRRYAVGSLAILILAGHYVPPELLHIHAVWGHWATAVVRTFGGVPQK